MVEFKTEKVTDRITRIYCVCTELCYLVEGDEKAVLIDTGSGYGHLRKVVDGLTDKPLTVLITHGHTDHAMGAGEFTDCPLYLPHIDEYIYKYHGASDFRHDGMMLAEEGVTIEEDEYIPTLPFSSFRDLKEGDVFDIGGEVIEIYACPGHTKGSVVMLMKNERIVLLGDACNNFTFMHENYAISIEHYLESLRTLKEKLSGKYDQVLASHGDGKLPLNIIEGNMQNCIDIINGNTDDIPMEFKGNKGLIAKAKPVCGNIVYSKEQIKKDGSLC